VTDGGGKIYIGRKKGQYEEFVSFTADIKATSDEAALVAAMSIEDQLQVVFELQMEFSRAKIAYKGIYGTAEAVPLTKRPNPERDPCRVPHSCGFIA
jgi:hypothetical protein